MRSPQVAVKSTLLFSTTEAEEILFSEKSVQASVSLASLSHEASERDDVVLGASHLSVFVNLQESE